MSPRKTKADIVGELLLINRQLTLDVLVLMAGGEYLDAAKSVRDASKKLDTVISQLPNDVTAGGGV